MRGWGADGCRCGWVICSYSPESGAGFELVQSIADFFDQKEFSELLFVDTPVGLSSVGWRECDLKLKTALGAKQSSVFMAPVRDAVWAKDYREACDINQKVTGKKISIQSWNICPPIREVDILLRDQIQLRNLVRESHPEFLFQFLNKGPLEFKKKENLGAEERLNILKSVGCDARNSVDTFFANTKRKDVKMDDIIDSLVLAFSSFLAQNKSLNSLPDSPEIDDYGIEMAIWYLKN